ncbi:MAG: ABC transporter ATP-binding protein, partial [Nitrospiria bacterium]
MIQVEHLTKQFGNRVAIQDLSFEASKGEVLGFLGPNGAGKTTTMRILTGFMPATSGTARVAGYDVWESPQEVKRRIGYLPEQPPLYNDMTVTEYLQFVAKIKGISPKQIKNSVRQVLEQCSLDEVRGRLIGNLSRGFRQRVGLAQALIHRPEVLILDEPTSGLDPKQIIEVRQLIKGLQGTHTVILSTHILPEVTAVCQRVVIINEGRVMAVDTHEGLTAKLRK